MRLHAPSGTTGKPIVAALHGGGCRGWSSVMLRTFAAAGISRGDIVQNAGYGLSSPAAWEPITPEALGSRWCRCRGQHRPAGDAAAGFPVNAICATPSYFLAPIERAGELGIDLRELPLRAASSAPSRGRRRWGRASRRTRASGLGTSTGCPRSSARRRRRMQHPGRPARVRGPLYPEIIDPETGAVLPDGEEGELLTTLLEARDADDPLPHPRHHPAGHRSPCAWWPQASAACSASAGAVT